MQRPMSATRGIQARLSESLRLTLVYRLARELNAELRSADVVRRVLHSTAEALGTPYASLVSLRCGEIDTAYAIGGAPRTDPRPVLARVLRDGLAGFVLESGRTMVVNDIEVNPLWLPLPDEPLSPQIGSALCVPLIHAGETVGVMTLAHPAREYFTADAINLTATISEMGAAALSNTLLVELAREAEQRYAALFDDAIVPIIITDPRRDPGGEPARVRVSRLHHDELTSAPSPRFHGETIGTLIGDDYDRFQRGQRCLFARPSFAKMARAARSRSTSSGQSRRGNRPRPVDRARPRRRSWRRRCARL